jgi:thiol-disulfide isomerase/thioredoxin
VATATMALVGVVALANLMLTYGVIRRLRAHDTALAGLSPAGQSDRDALPVGSALPEFTAVTTDGLEVDSGWLLSGTVVAFLSPDCRPCQEQLPLFVRYAAGWPGGPRRVLAVVVGRAEQAGQIERVVGELAGVAHVVVASADTPVVDAFRATAFPTFLVIDDGLVAASGHRVAALPAPARA